MKRIVLNQEGCPPTSIVDDDESNIEDYSQKISELLKSSNITILHTTTTSTIVRPSKLTSIVVEDIIPEIQMQSLSQEKKVPKKKEVKPPKKPKPKKEKAKEIDIITDRD